METTDHVEIDEQSGVESTSVNTGKKRKLTSSVWKDFRLLPQQQDQPLYCQCLKCGTQIQAGSRMGTGNLHRHLKVCVNTHTRDIGQYMISSSKGVIDMRNSKYVVFDPRYKFNFVKFSYNKLYGEESSQLKMVEDALYALFDEYMQTSTASESASFKGNIGERANVEKEPNDSIFEEFDEYDNDDSSSVKKTQLQVYLLEPRAKITSSIDMLQFWKSKQHRYPELAKLAMDILCVPVSTVASESAFSLGGRVLNEYRSSMKPDVVEALICSRDWLFGEKIEPVELDVDIEELAKNIMDMSFEDKGKDEEATNSTKH